MHKGIDKGMPTGEGGLQGNGNAEQVGVGADASSIKTHESTSVKYTIQADRLIETGGKIYPVLFAEVTTPPNTRRNCPGGQIRVWCRFCEKHHYHGYGSGHKVAHCVFTPTSKSRRSEPVENPYRQTGYYVLLPGDTLEKMMGRYGRQWRAVAS